MLVWGSPREFLGFLAQVCSSGLGMLLTKDLHGFDLDSESIPQHEESFLLLGALLGLLVGSENVGRNVVFEVKFVHNRVKGMEEFILA